MKLRFLGVTALSATLVSGCTHLEVNRHGPDSTGSRSGYAYMLDFTQYQIELKRTLISCDADKVPEVKTEATITALLAPDGEQVYVIDPESMISAFKTSDISITYKDGRLVAFNASTVDKTGDVIASVAATAGKVVLLASGIPIPVSDKAGKAQMCKDDAVSNLALIEANKKPIKAATDALDEANAKLAVLTAQFATKPTEKLRTQIEARTKANAAAKKQLDAITKASSDAQAWLTDRRTATWPDDSSTFHAWSAYPLPIGTADKWFKGDAIRGVIARDQTKTWEDTGDDNKIHLIIEGERGAAYQLGMSPEAFRARYPELNPAVDVTECRKAAGSACGIRLAQLDNDLVNAVYYRSVRAPIALHLVRRGSYGSDKPSAGSSHPKAGLRYRVPAAGTFLICEANQECGDGSGSEPIAKVNGAIAQLGTVFNISFSSPAFASGSVSATFDDQGRLLTAGLKRDNAAALAAANAVGSTVDEAGKVVKAKKGAELAGITNATTLAKAKADLAKAEEGLTKTPQQLASEQLTALQTQQQIEAIQATLGPSQAKDLTNQVAVAKLQLDLAETQRKRAEDPHADQAAVKAQYDAQTGVTNARITSLEAEARMVEAERALAKAKAGS
ncbi:hypothetical protein D0Z70_19960 [Sphingobium terrigena]|uniref:Uncharacterized protein n=1 Tax=Sphingobium terrigena TaxID=2304063 RepID=A0A418YMV2_9SPHN|nr:hypothetical protein [Sphingobium terrigena]RJG52485.1 hypothetical protein D0Z70_19960 [Sphingobium terrigena]